MFAFSQRVIQKLQPLYFAGKLRLYGYIGLPVQTKKERRIFKTIFNHIPRYRKLTIFEWGSGYSTLYYADYLFKKGIDFEWHSIDNNKAWHEKVKKFTEDKKLQTRVQLYLMEFSPFWEKPGWGPLPPPCGVFGPRSQNENSYIDFPRHLGKKIDVVIVDARFRKCCIRSAREVVRPEGIVILHDAQKPHYHEGLETFPYQRFIDSGAWYPLQEVPNRMWIGSLTDHPVFKHLKTF